MIHSVVVEVLQHEKTGHVRFGLLDCAVRFFQLLPYGRRSFRGYRLLHEYFALPNRYMFIELAGLADTRNDRALAEDEGWDPGQRVFVIFEEMNATGWIDAYRRVWERRLDRFGAYVEERR